MKNIFLSAGLPEPKDSILLTNSLSNEIRLCDGKLIARIKKPSDSSFYNPETEYEVIKAASSLEPNVLFFDKSTGDKIEEYLSSEAFEPSEGNIKKSLDSIKKLQQIAGISSEFELEARYTLYASKSSLRVLPDFENKLNFAMRDFYRTSHFVLSHNDLSEGNILIGKEATFIDWEFGGMNHPYFDVASLLGENGITDLGLLRKYFDYYLGKPSTEKQFNRFLIILTHSHYLWMYWADMRYAETGDRRFESISLIKRKAIIQASEYFKGNPSAWTVM